LISRSELLSHIPGLRRYARALVRDPDRADDLVQDCLERALGKGHLWQPRPGGQGLRAWLLTIMHNLHIDQARRRTSMPPEVPLEASGPLAEPARQSDRIALGELAAALDRLPDDQREVLLLVGLEGMSYRDAATVMAVPMGTVMSRLARARERLRTMLAGETTPPLRRVK
jgi:RNA polymerase sigma-70 factor (ECF subfamily)